VPSPGLRGGGGVVPTPRTGEGILRGYGATQYRNWRVPVLVGKFVAETGSPRTLRGFLENFFSYWSRSCPFIPCRAERNPVNKTDPPALSPEGAAHDEADKALGAVPATYGWPLCVGGVAQLEGVGYGVPSRAKGALSTAKGERHVRAHQ
jgi:hypothetical protein